LPSMKFAGILSKFQESFMACSIGAKATKSKKHMGSSIEEFLKEEGIFEETQVQAVKEVIAWQLSEAVKKQKISQNKMAAPLKTKRTQCHRLLHPKND
jgi:antitoxin HicB